MTPLALRLGVIALAGLSMALPAENSLVKRWDIGDCTRATRDDQLLGANDCQAMTPSGPVCHWCCATWPTGPNSDGPNCHDHSDPSNLCTGSRPELIHCGSH